MGFLSDMPIVGDLYDAARGNPDAVKAAYDQQIKASQASQQQLQNFLMGQKGKTLAYYAPLQHMFQRAYGTEGIMGPEVPGGSQPPLSAMYGQPAGAGGMPAAGPGQQAAMELNQRDLRKGR